MGIYLAEQSLVFLQSILVGATLGLLYDVFRISRVAFPTPSAVVLAEDILFFIICALCTFFFGLTVIDGMLRVFLIIGELIGGVLYFLTVGRLVMSISKKIIAAIKAILSFIMRFVVRPIWFLVYHIMAFILRPFVFLSRIFKKTLQKTKIRLKTRRRVLYNQLKGYSKTKRTAKKHKGRKNEKTQSNIT